MTKEEKAKILKTRTELLMLSRKVPTRPCSPYGQLDVDDAEILRVGREGYEAIFALTKAWKD